MATRTKLAAVLSGLVQNVDLTADELVVLSLKVGGGSGTTLTLTILNNLVNLQNGTDFATGTNSHTHDGRYFTETELGATSGTTGSDLIGDDDTYATATPSAATVKGALEGLDSEMANRIRKDGSVTFTADQSMGGFKLTNVGTPTSGSDAANKTYVDNAINGLDWKQSVRVATTAAGTLASDFENGDTVDGIVLATGNRILIKNQATGSENGIYTVNASGAPTRATDADVSSEVTSGLAVFVEEGTTNADSGWVLTTDGTITLGTTSLTFAQFTGTGSITAGAGLTKTGNTIDFNTADTSLTVNADNVAVNLNTTGGLETSSGVRIKSDTTTANTIGITTTSNGAGVKFDSASFADSGSETLALASGVAGSGLALTSGVLSVNVAAAGGIEISSDNLQIKSDTATANTIGVTTTSNGAGTKFDSNSFVDSGSETLALASGVAGAGLTLTTGVLAVGAGDGISVAADSVAVSVSAIAGTGLEDDGSNNLRIASSAAGSGLTGGSGSALSVGAGNGIQVNADDVEVLHSPLIKKSMVAGEAYAANTSFLVRFAVNGETAGRMYKATKASAAADLKFYAVGIILSGSALSAGNSGNVTLMGTHTLGSSDTAFGATDIGKAVYLSTGGAWTLTPPSDGSGEAAYRIGIVEDTNKIWVDTKQLNGIA